MVRSLWYHSQDKTLSGISRKHTFSNPDLYRLVDEDKSVFNKMFEVMQQSSLRKQRGTGLKKMQDKQNEVYSKMLGKKQCDSEDDEYEQKV